MKSSDKAYNQQNFILDFTDSSCQYSNAIPDSIDEIRECIKQCDEAINDWLSIIDFDDDPEIIRMNRSGLQRVKTEKKYLKNKLKELLAMDKTTKREVAYS